MAFYFYTVHVVPRQMCEYRERNNNLSRKNRYCEMKPNQFTEDITWASAAKHMMNQ